VKRLLALLLGGLGLRALLRRRSEPAPLERPADDLRQKLAEARATVEEQIEDAESVETQVDDRRADVHARARQTIDELKDT
jgi:phage shock protein A